MEQLEFHKGNESALMEKKENRQLHKGSLYHCLDTKNTFFAISGDELDRYSSAVGWQSASQGEVFNDYENNRAEGQFSHAEGISTKAKSGGAHAEGESTIAYTTGSHAEGKSTLAGGKSDSDVNNNGSYAHAEGVNSIAYARGSHAEGDSTLADGRYSHAEGGSCQALGDYSHAEGCNNGSFSTVARGQGSHAEGMGTQSTGNGSHAEGKSTTASGVASHVEGNNSQTDGQAAHAEGEATKAYGNGAHAEGKNTTAGTTDQSKIGAHAEGFESQALNSSAHAEGYNTRAIGDASHSEGNNTIAHGKGAHAEGFESMAGAKKILNEDKVSFTISYSSDSNGAHAEGIQVSAFASGSHAEGMLTYAERSYSHAEGNTTRALGQNSHAEGFNTVAQGNNSHAEGNTTLAKGENSHAEGYNTMANEVGSHAEGGYASANHAHSHVEGFKTATGGDYQHVQGKFNISRNTSEYAHIVGNGTEDNKRSNAHTLDWQGNAWFAGEVRVGGENYEDAVSLRNPDWRHLKWYVIGDSLTIPGNGGDDKYMHTTKFYYEYIQEKTHIQFVEIDGVGGTGYYAGTTSDSNFYFRISQNIGDIQTADIITILGSVNDVRHSTQEQYQPVIEHTLATLTSTCPGVPVIIIPPPLCDDYEKTSDAWTNYCNTLKEAAFKNHCRYVEDMYKCPPFDPRIESHRAKFFNNDDGTHPNEVGHKAIASYVYNAMRTALVFE